MILAPIPALGYFGEVMKVPYRHLTPGIPGFLTNHPIFFHH